MSYGRTRRPEGGANLYSLPTSFIAVDTETTGLDFDLCNIIEIGAVKVENGEIVDSFKTLIKVDEKLPPFIVHLTGITDEMLADAPSLNEVMTDFDAFVGDSILLAHNAAFDMNFLYTAYERALGKPLSNDYVDTLRVARRALPQLQHRTLSDLCAVFEVVNEGEHRAYGDALATVQCYLRMRDIVIESFGDETAYAGSFARGTSSGSHIKAKDIVATADDIDEGNPLFGMRCVFTGATTFKSLPKMIPDLRTDDATAISSAVSPDVGTITSLPFERSDPSCSAAIVSTSSIRDSYWVYERPLQDLWGASIPNVGVAVAMPLRNSAEFPSLGCSQAVI